jgi:hypothetical protein
VKAAEHERTELEALLASKAKRPLMRSDRRDAEYGMSGAPAWSSEAAQAIELPTCSPMNRSPSCCRRAAGARGEGARH